MNIQIKRAYDKPNKSDGYRVLVDRLWPRGVKKEALALNDWAKDIAPSSELRTWFNHDPAKFNDFSKRYQAELKPKINELKQILKQAESHKSLTLIYSAHDTEHNQAVVLKEFLSSSLLKNMENTPYLN